MGLPALPADESAQSSGNLTDTSTNEHRTSTLASSSQQLENFTQPRVPNSMSLQQQQQQQHPQQILPQQVDSQQHQVSQQQQQQQPAFMDQSFFYGFDQLSSDNPLFFMQQHQQQHQQQLQQQTASLFEDHFLKEATDHDNAGSSSSANDNRGTMNGSSTTLAQSIATSMESFQAAVTTSVGEQPASFWTGLNNVSSTFYMQYNSGLIIQCLVYFQCDTQQYISNISQHCTKLSRVFSQSPGAVFELFVSSI